MDIQRYIRALLHQHTYIVIAANEDYVSNRVNFSARSAPNVSVLNFLREIELSEAKATTDTVTIKRLAEVCQSSGFDREGLR